MDILKRLDHLRLRYIGELVVVEYLFVLARQEEQFFLTRVRIDNGF